MYEGMSCQFSCLIAHIFTSVKSALSCSCNRECLRLKSLRPVRACNMQRIKLLASFIIFDMSQFSLAQKFAPSCRITRMRSLQRMLDRTGTASVKRDSTSSHYTWVCIENYLAHKELFVQKDWRQPLSSTFLTHDVLEGTALYSLELLLRSRKTVFLLQRLHTLYQSNFSYLYGWCSTPLEHQCLVRT